MNLSTTQLAATLGISRQRVNELGRLGKIHREKDGNWDAAKVSVALGRNLDTRQAAPSRGEEMPRNKGGRPRQVRPPQQPTHPRQESGSMADAQLLKTRAQAAQEAMLAKKMEGSLIERAAVESQWSDIAVRLRNAVMGLPAKIVNRLPAEWRRDVLIAAQDEARRVLAALSDEIRSDPKPA
jgi:hypothetical protein